MGEHVGLIERLRNYRGGYFHERDCHGAANVIEQLEAALRASTELLRQGAYRMVNTAPAEYQRTLDQIDANNAALGGGK